MTETPIPAPTFAQRMQPSRRKMLRRILMNTYIVLVGAYGLNVTALIANNGAYGTIRMHQERDYPARVSGTDLVNPDFAKFAESFGAFGARVEKTEDFPAAFKAARASGKPAVIDLICSANEIAPGRTIDALRRR